MIVICSMLERERPIENSYLKSGIKEYRDENVRDVSRIIKCELEEKNDLWQ